MIIESYPANRRAAWELGRDTGNLSDPISFFHDVYILWTVDNSLSLKNRTKEF